ncbi:protein Njmu-R1-like [Poecilia reticulata]|uniref:protein Njmu-R1-like n=1 Tax=Poecilia reticulata TaxID=8081 RepID=UPI0007EBE87C|nr:PREDICTED: protein Njmu-R1-like [Poecilia reticulata]
MFSSQTSSFQDSIDVEERDEFDSEDIAGYSQKIQLNCYYTIYLYQGTRSEACGENVAWNQRRADSTSHDDFSLTLIDSSLPSEAEPELRTYISRRLSKGALLGGMGNIATVELSLPEQAIGCYCCLLEQERSPEQPDADGNGYVICFMGGSEKGLNLFRLELDKYVQGLHSSLQTPELQNLETEVRPYLGRWYEESVMHIYQVVQLVQSNISFLLHAMTKDSLVYANLLVYSPLASSSGVVHMDEAVIPVECHYERKWRSADGNDYLCGYCKALNQVPGKSGIPGMVGPRGFGKVANLDCTSLSHKQPRLQYPNLSSPSGFTSSHSASPFQLQVIQIQWSQD